MKGSSMIKKIFIIMLLSGVFSCSWASNYHGNQQMTTIAVSLEAPDSGWKLTIEEIRQVDEELWVLATLKKDPNLFAMAMITTVSDAVTIQAPALPIKYFIQGKTWNWENKEPYRFINSKSEIEAKFNRGKRLFP
jgi:hypothetical protein